MKYLMALTTLTLMHLIHPASANASGCGGVEYYIDSTTVLEKHAFKKAVESYDIVITTMQGGVTRSVQLDFSTKIMSRPKDPSFFWHEALTEGTAPTDVDAKELEKILATSTVELVEDKYSFNCGSPTGKDTERNFRIKFDYHGTPVEIRTHYVPDAVDR